MRTRSKDRQHRYAVLLAGGQGARFWPQSRTLMPKQFLQLNSDITLFEQTIKRILPIIPPGNIFIVTSELYSLQIKELTLPYGLKEKNLIFEPDPRNTAASIALACRIISQLDHKAVLGVLPCDHLINNHKQFIKILNRAFADCAERLVIFGIPPDRPATGYGYINVKGTGGKKGLYAVERFTEKPDLQRAKRFLRQKTYYWNSGMFVGNCTTFEREFSRHTPELYAALSGVSANDSRQIAKCWGKIKPVSFDYAVLEKSASVMMLRAEGLGWSDLGSWQSWDNQLEKDSEGNAIVGDVVNIASNNTTVLGKDRLIATIGLENLIVVDTPDALLITKKDKSEQVKEIVESLKKRNRQEYYLHKTVKRPWGSYTVLDSGFGFKIKLVEVKPQASLSLQLHKRRAEHWVVVSGTAKVVKGRKVINVNSNESTYIPFECVHRLTNPGQTPLKIVEIQSGDYLEEDDIIRLKDDFGRT